MLNKLPEGSTVTCFKCHQEDHKSFHYKQVKKETKEKKMMNLFNKTFNLYTKPNYKIKTKSNHYKLKKKIMTKWLDTWLGEKIVGGTNPFVCPRKSSLT